MGPLPDWTRLFAEISAAGVWILLMAVHAVAFLLVYQYGYARGRGAERREQKQRDLAARREA